MNKLGSNDNIFIIDTKQKEKEYGIFLRALSDFIIVPSIKEGYGLVAGT
jgi:hypothetical protein